MNYFYNKEVKEETTIHYHGSILPDNKKSPVAIPIDLANNPSIIKIGPVTLPQDTAIYINGNKVIAQSKILDGVVVYERILRDPYSIEFEMVIRETETYTTPSGNTGSRYIFPKNELGILWDNVWLIDSVQSIQNTMLNDLGIMEVVIQSINPVTVRGSKNVPVRIKCLENVPGESLIID